MKRCLLVLVLLVCNREIVFVECNGEIVFVECSRKGALLRGLVSRLRNGKTQKGVASILLSPDEVGRRLAYWSWSYARPKVKHDKGKMGKVLLLRKRTTQTSTGDGEGTTAKSLINKEFPNGAATKKSIVVETLTPDRKFIVVTDALGEAAEEGADNQVRATQNVKPVLGLLSRTGAGHAAEDVLVQTESSFPGTTSSDVAGLQQRLLSAEGTTPVVRNTTGQRQLLSADTCGGTMTNEDAQSGSSCAWSNQAACSDDEDVVRPTIGMSALHASLLFAEQPHLQGGNVHELLPQLPHMNLAAEVEEGLEQARARGLEQGLARGPEQVLERQVLEQHPFMVADDCLEAATLVIPESDGLAPRRHAIRLRTSESGRHRYIDGSSASSESQERNEIAQQTDSDDLDFFEAPPVALPPAEDDDGRHLRDAMFPGRMEEEDFHPSFCDPLQRRGFLAIASDHAPQLQGDEIREAADPFDLVLQQLAMEQLASQGEGVVQRIADREVELPEGERRTAACKDRGEQSCLLFPHYSPVNYSEDDKAPLATPFPSGDIYNPRGRQEVFCGATRPDQEPRRTRKQGPPLSKDLGQLQEDDEDPLQEGDPSSSSAWLRDHEHEAEKQCDHPYLQLHAVDDPMAALYRRDLHRDLPVESDDPENEDAPPSVLSPRMRSRIENLHRRGNDTLPSAGSGSASGSCASSSARATSRYSGATASTVLTRAGHQYVGRTCTTPTPQGRAHAVESYHSAHQSASRGQGEQQHQDPAHHLVNPKKHEEPSIGQEERMTISTRQDMSPDDSKSLRHDSPTRSGGSTRPRETPTRTRSTRRETPTSTGGSTRPRETATSTCQHNSPTSTCQDRPTTMSRGAIPLRSAGERQDITPGSPICKVEEGRESASASTTVRSSTAASSK
ncbi:unnamed protein product [Amoebophrya sp. A25]|nr:unnamed protein product [Amoebophrya sp. A25]|eukprot:GSA25T00020213001.1